MRVHSQIAYRKETVMHVWSHNLPIVSSTQLHVKQNIDISDSKAVIRYLEGLIGKMLRCLFGSITHRSYLAYSSKPENRYFQ